MSSSGTQSVGSAQPVVLSCLDACRLPIDQLIRLIRQNVEARRQTGNGCGHARHCIETIVSRGLVCDRNNSFNHPPIKQLLPDSLLPVHGSVCSLTTPAPVLSLLSRLFFVPSVSWGRIVPIRLFSFIPRFYPASSYTFDRPNTNSYQ